MLIKKRRQTDSGERQTSLYITRAFARDVLTPEELQRSRDEHTERNPRKRYRHAEITKPIRL